MSKTKGIALGTQFGVSRNQARLVVIGKNWRHLPDAALPGKISKIALAAREGALDH